MAKSKEKILARKLRKNGLSMKEISQRLKVSKGSISLWCSDIELTKKQIQILHDKMVRGSYIGRMIGTQIQKDKKRRSIEECLLQGKRDIPILKKRELFIAGLGLYWGEGSKKSAVRFYNSDPNAVKFMMEWFRKILEIEEDRFYMYININQIHKRRLKKVIRYWAEVTGISVAKFRKPSLIKAKNKKTYDNLSEHYGTLCIRIARSGNLLYKILGWIRAMKEAG
jgi:transcriptional regulator with XRE-family HTH domain